MASAIAHGSIWRIGCGAEVFELGSLVDGQKVFCIDDESSASDRGSDSIHQSERQPYSEVIIEAEDGIIARFENYHDAILRNREGHIDSACIDSQHDYHLGDTLDGRKIAQIRYYNSKDNEDASIIPCYYLRASDYHLLKILRGGSIVTHYKPVEYF